MPFVHMVDASAGHWVFMTIALITGAFALGVLACWYIAWRLDGAPSDVERRGPGVGGSSAPARLDVRRAA
jgi:hypothetical protein